MERLNNVSVIVPTLPAPGLYDGLWSGYVVRFHAGGVEYTADSTLGIRGMNIKCSVLVKGNECYVLGTEEAKAIGKPTAAKAAKEK